MAENEKVRFENSYCRKRRCPFILEFVKGIAEFENLSHLVTATEESLMESMFGKKSYAEVFLPNWMGSCRFYGLFS